MCMPDGREVDLATLRVKCPRYDDWRDEAQT